VENKLEIFKRLKESGYQHYTENSVEELDELALSDPDIITEYAHVIQWLLITHEIHVRYTIDILGSDEWEYGYSIWYIPKEFQDYKRRSPHYVEKLSFQLGYGTYNGAWDTPQEAYLKALDYILKNLI
jgi:hypothetical protein